MSIIHKSEKGFQTTEKSLKAWLDFFPDEEKWISLPKSTLTKEEVIIAATLGVWLVRYLNNENTNFSSIDEFFLEVAKKKRSSGECSLLWQFITEILEFLAKKMPVELTELLKTNLNNFTNLIREDLLGTVLQRALTSDIRKKLAANYTTLPSSKILCTMLPNKRFEAIIDPFCGSGRLVSVNLDNLRTETDFPQLIWLNDSHATAVLIAYSRILLSLSHQQNNSTKVIATIGNAFKEISPHRFKTSFDLVLMNPPFTRTHRINKSQRKTLLPLHQKYKRVLKGQPGLHVYGILLADQILRNKGTLGAILPGATFLSTYSRGLQEYFTTEYQTDTILTSETKKSFSEDSDLREIMLISQKRNPNSNHKVQFHVISDSQTNSKQTTSIIRSVALNNLKSDWNWMRYFHPESIIQFRQRLLKTNKIKSGEILRLRIVRGVEMYGPDFFFLTK